MLHLTDNDRALLAGNRGPGSQMAMRIIVRMAEVFGAGELLDITAAHIDSTIFMGDATLEYAERLADLGATVAVPATSNVSGVDEHGWQRVVGAAGLGREGASADGRVPSHGRDRQLHLRARTRPSCAPSSASRSPGASRTRSPSPTQCWGADRALPRPARHLRGDHGPRPGGRVAPDARTAPGQLLIRLVDVPPSLQADDSFYPVLGHSDRQAGG